MSGPCAVPEVRRIADGELPGALDQARDHLVVQLLGDEETRARLAGLPLVEEAAEERAVDRHVEVGVVEDDVGRLAAQLEHSSSPHSAPRMWRLLRPSSFEAFHGTRRTG